MCPDNKPSRGDCRENPCNGTDFCTVLQHEGLCCDYTTPPCTESGMHGFRSYYVNEVVSLDWLNYLSENKKWYKKSYESAEQNNSIACPVPYSFVLSNDQHQHWLTEFVINGKLTEKKCNSHSQCDPTEFCGSSHNPSYCENPNVHNSPFNNSCLDKSADGAAKAFCFPAPKFQDNIFAVYRESIDLKGCNSHYDCQHEALFCDSTRPMKEYRNGTIVNYKGLCYTASVCDGIYDETPFGKIGKNGKFCTLGTNDTCNEPNSRCIQPHARVNKEKMTFCCTRRQFKNQTTTTTIVSTPSTPGKPRRQRRSETKTVWQMCKYPIVIEVLVFYAVVLFIESIIVLYFRLNYNIERNVGNRKEKKKPPMKKEKKQKEKPMKKEKKQKETLMKKGKKQKKPQKSTNKTTNKSTNKTTNKSTNKTTNNTSTTTK